MHKREIIKELLEKLGKEIHEDHLKKAIASHTKGGVSTGGPAGYPKPEIPPALKKPRRNYPRD